MVVQHSTLLDTDSTITNNRYSSSDVGILASFGANVTMKQVRCSLNSADMYGGCVRTTGMNSSLVVQNCNISNDSC